MSTGSEVRDDARAAIAYLRTPEAIRDRCGQVFAAGVAGQLRNFAVALDRLDVAAERVVAVTRAAYPDLAIPRHSRWRHFKIGDVDRVGGLALPGDDRERGRSLYDLVITSVLLDAGAGAGWRYREPDTGGTFARSEGLAVASFHMFARGGFSSSPDSPCRADADRLAAMAPGDLATHFQVDVGNPLAGLEGRAALLARLGRTVAENRAVFGGPGGARLGHLFDHLHDQATGGALPARAILAAVLEALGPIWPPRVTVDGVDVGDVWPHPAAGGSGPGAGLVPFHKLSQWLTYSLIEPLEWAGVSVTHVGELTGLAEYRNGGLFVDTGVLTPKHDAVTADAHRPDSEIIVEWRALTVALLDRVAARVRSLLDKSEAELSLARILEGGTWAAGRHIAGELRPGGPPPIRIVSDGTVF